jgi:hypothetical protein
MNTSQRTVWEKFKNERERKEKRQYLAFFRFCLKKIYLHFIDVW